MNPLIEVRKTPEKGYGLFTKHPLPPGVVVGLSKIVIVEGVLDSNINDYCFKWGTDDECIVFGEVSFANHSSTPNCKLYKDVEGGYIGLETLEYIPERTELTFSYGCAIWFEEK
jgi:SET domain-containing protein